MTILRSHSSSRIGAVAIALACFVLAFATYSAGAALDGTKWTITVTPDATVAAKGEKAFEDTLVFENGMMTSTACEEYGFHAAPYTAEIQKKSTTWSAEPASVTEGKSKWEGAIQEGRMTGKMTWTKPDGTVFNYAFEGSEVK